MHWEPSSVQRCPALEQEAMGTVWSTGTPSEHRAALCAVWVTECWHRLPRGHGVSSLGISKTHLHAGLASCSGCCCFNRVWTR